VRYSLLSVALLCALSAVTAILVFQARNPLPALRYACPTSFNPEAVYVAPPGEGYDGTGVIANAYNFGVLYARCQK